MKLGMPRACGLLFIITISDIGIGLIEPITQRRCKYIQQQEPASAYYNKEYLLVRIVIKRCVQLHGWLRKVRTFRGG